MRKLPFSRAYYVITTLCCLAALGVALLFAFNLASFEFGRHLAAGDVSSAVSLSLRSGIGDILAQVGVSGKVSLFVSLLFSVSVAAFSITTATLAFVFSSIMIAVVINSAPASAFSPTLIHAIAVLAVVYGCYLLSRLVQHLLHRRKVGQKFKHYVSSNITDYYIQNPAGMDAVSASRELTILFCDIKCFTGISETLAPDRLREWLNAYFTVVSHVIHQHGGTVDKYMGDSVMAFWGAPWASDTHATDAVFASRKIQQEVAALSLDMQKVGLPAITIGIGVSTGFANVGHMGSKYHMTYTAVGDAVNTANRLQRCTGYYQLPLVVSEATVEKVPEYLFRELDTVHVKGRQRFVRLFEPVCPVDEASPGLLKRLQLHRKAMQFFRRGMWVDAENVFTTLSLDGSGDKEFYKKYVDRIEKIKQTSPTSESAHIVDLTRQMG